jgi:hypothetical protein
MRHDGIGLCMAADLGCMIPGVDCLQRVGHGILFFSLSGTES